MVIPPTHEALGTGSPPPTRLSASGRPHAFARAL